MLLEGECEQVVLISIYVIVSSVIKGLSKNLAIPRLRGSARGRKPDLDFVATVALALFRYALNIKDVKHYHRYLLSHYRGWYFGFKLGVVVDLAGRLMSVALGPGNMDDRKFLSFLFENIEGLAVGDAGFVSKVWMKNLYEKGLFFITDVKKNMKRLMTPAQHRLLKSRQNVEIRLSQLKHRLQQGVTIARSPKGYFSRWIYATLAYCIFPLVESYFG
jgi:hypothetical protein